MMHQPRHSRAMVVSVGLLLFCVLFARTPSFAVPKVSGVWVMGLLFSSLLLHHLCMSDGVCAWGLTKDDADRNDDDRCEKFNHCGRCPATKVTVLQLEYYILLAS